MIDFKNYERVTNTDDKQDRFCFYDCCVASCDECVVEQMKDRLTKLEDLIEQGKLVEKSEPTTAKERVEFELAELVERKENFFYFLTSNKYDMLDIKSKELLNKQLGIMIDYIEVLEEILKIWECESND